MFSDDFRTSKGRNIWAWRVIDSLARAPSIHQYVLWPASVALRPAAPTTRFHAQLRGAGCQPVCGLTVVTHPNRVIVPAETRHLNSLFHVIVPSSRVSATHCTHSAATDTRTAAGGRAPRSSPADPQPPALAARGPHQLVPGTSHTSPLPGLPLQPATAHWEESQGLPC